MKVNFSNSVSYVPAWNGNDKLPADEQIKLKLTVLNMGALMGLLDVFTQMGLDGEVDTEKVEGSKIKPILEQFGELLPKHVESIEGLYAKNGEAMKVEDIVKYPFFLNLSLEILMKLAEISSPSDEDAKNSNAPSA